MKDFSTAVAEGDLNLAGGALVEAGAGTGKTYNIQSAYLRLVAANGLRVRNILVVTFTEAATAELRERLRGILAEAAADFSQAIRRAGDGEESGVAMAGGGVSRVAPFRQLPVSGARIGARAGTGDGVERFQRVRRALQDFDNAAIFTIHGFCKRVLDQHAFECGADPEAEILPDSSEVLATLCRDWWRRNAYGDPERARTIPFPEFAKLQATVAAAAAHPLAKLKPDMPRGEREPVVRQFMAALARTLKTHPEAEPTNEAGREIEGALRGVNHLLQENPEAPPERLFYAAHPLLCFLAKQIQAEDGGKIARWEAFGGGKGKVSWRERLPEVAPLAETAALALLSERNEIVREILGEFRTALREQRVTTYDTLLTQTHAALLDPASGQALCHILREEYHAALVDEFQDTDPIQEEIFRTLFGGALPAPFLQVGDPKQAIYAFRGGDVFTYYAAARRLPDARRFRLGTNYRSAPELVSAVNAFFADNPACPDAPAFANKHIAFVPLRSQELAPAKRLTFPPETAAGERRFDSAPFKLWAAANPEIKGGALKRGILERVVDEISELLDAAAAPDGPRVGDRPLNAGDIAILVCKNHEAAEYRDALRKREIPSVHFGTENLFDALVARRFAILMRALLDPSRLEALRSVNHCGLFPPQPLDRLAPLFRDAAKIWSRHDFLRAYAKVAGHTGIREHTAAFGDGDPTARVAALDQLAALANSAARNRSPDELCRWFSRQLDPETRDDDESFCIQPSTDGAAVRILTIHKSKGLEFPIVFVPTLWGKEAEAKGRYIAWHDADGGAVFDLKDDNPVAHTKEHRRERFEEDIRLAYVALTRAINRLYLAVGPASESDGQSDGSEVALSYLHGRMATPPPPEIQIIQMDYDSPPQGRAPRHAPRGEDAGAFKLVGTPFVDKRAAHTSFTTLAAHSPEMAGEAGEGDDAGTDDDADDDGTDVDGAAAAAASDAEETADSSGALLTDILLFPAGTATGECWHEIFEKIDFQAAPEDWRARSDEILQAHNLCDTTRPNRLRTAVHAMIARTLTTPLPPISGVAARSAEPPFILAEIPASARRHELAFHLTLNNASAALAEVAALLEKHWNPDPEFVRELRRNPAVFPTGWLTGSIDLLFEHGERFYIADWKSNRIHSRPEDFDPPGLAREMTRHAYPLQLLLYTLAAHVWLRQTLNGYDYDLHFGGVYYVFLRGLDGTPNRGIHTARPPGILISALEQLLLP